MIRSFFRSLDRHGVRYLLVSGQACVLYGASQFTEDIDLWVRPTREDWDGMRNALSDVGAVVYKLTPPLTLRNLRRGHGFHFLILPDTYIDVMGKPPRVGSFPAAGRRARALRTDWGRLPVIAPEDLVLLKRTNRSSDYEAISNLARLRLSESPEDPRVMKWAIENTFDPEDLARWLASARTRGIRAARKGWVGSSRTRAARFLALDALKHQEAGRRYWLPIIRELRRLRQDGKLIPPGTPVASLR